MAHQYSSEVSGKLPKYKRGEKKASYYKRAFKAVTTKVDVKKLNKPNAEFLAPYVIPKEQRKQRREESDRMRRKLIEIQGFKADRAPVKLQDHMGRAHAVACYYFAHIGHPELIDRYEQIFQMEKSVDQRAAELEAQKIPKEQAQQQAEREESERAYARGHFLAEIMGSLSHYTAEVLVNMTPEEAEAHMADISFLYAVGMNAEPFLKLGPDSGDRDVKFSPEDYEKTKYLLHSYNAASIPVVGLYTRANPYYELLDTDRMRQTMTVENALMFPMVSFGETDFENLCTDLMNGIMNKRVAVQDMIADALTQCGIDLKQPYTAIKPDGTSIHMVGAEASDSLEYLYSGGEAFVQQGDNTIRVAMTNADGKIKVVDGTGAEISKEIREKLRTAEKRAAEAKKRADEDRKRAAKQREAEAQARRKEEQRAAKQREAEARAQREAEQRAAEAEARREELLNTFHSKFGDVQKLAITNNLFATERFGIDNAIRAGMMDLFGKMEAHVAAKQLDQPIDRTVNSTEEHTLLWMTIKAMIVQDENLRKKENEGPLTKALNAGNITLDKLAKTIRRTPSYQKMLGNMTFKGLYDFVVEGKYTKLAQQVSKDCANMVKQQQAQARAQQPQPKAQAQAQQQPQQAPVQQPQQPEGVRGVTSAETIKALFDEGYAENKNAIDAAMNDADPWYIHSSTRFRAMKQRYEELKTLGDRLSDDPAVQAQQKAKLDELKTAANSYINWKGPGTNELENKRIALAQQIKQMATDKWDILERPEREAKQKAEEEAAAQAREDERLKALRAPFIEKLKKFTELPTQSDGIQMEIINGVMDSAGRGIDKAYMKNPDLRIDSAEGSPEEMVMAYMTLKALALNDEAGHSKENPGNLTKALKKEGTRQQILKVLRQTPSYQDKLANMTRKDLYDFVIEGGYKQFVQQVSKDFAEVAQKQQREEQERELQAQAEARAQYEARRQKQAQQPQGRQL